MKSEIISACLLKDALRVLAIFLPLCTHADLSTYFQGTSLDTNLFLDVPNTSVGTITLQTDTHKLLFSGSGADLWTSRNGLPYAWTPTPDVGIGGVWQAETEVQFYDTSTHGRIVGMTTYPGPDGAGGSSAGQEFTFGLDHWDSPNGVWVQGLGDNQPGDSANLSKSLTTDVVDLRMVVTNGLSSDTYVFYYKLATNETWNLLGSMHDSHINDRVALFFKGQDMNVTFNYYTVTSLVVGAEYAFTTNADNTLTITAYRSLKNDVTVPEQIGGLSVSTIASSVFANRSRLARVTIPDSVSYLGYGVFYNCTSLTSVTIPAGLTSLGEETFGECTSLANVYFRGDAPSMDWWTFENDWYPPTLYYLSGTTGWEDAANNTGLSTVLWNPVIQSGALGFGPIGEGFYFNVSGTADIPIEVDACTDLAKGDWSPLLTTTLSDGSLDFTDTAQTNYPARFYRISGP